MVRGESPELGERLQATLGAGYRVERELGGGGMSRVFLVQDVDLNRTIVVKVLPPDLAAGLSVERFKREIQLAAKLQHPHIVPLLTAGARDSLLYYAMPFIAGESLRSRLAKQHELPIFEAIRILRDVVDALAYSHANGVLHRDIKPDNVLLSGHHALVTDFGVSKAVASSTDDTGITSVGIALGTPAYMSPEQASADPSVDHRADIYSVGALAYELLTGQTPFCGLSPQQTLAAHITKTPEPITVHRDSVSPGLEQVVMRCLEKKRADRWQSAEELLAQLEVLATPSGGMTPPTLAPHRIRASRVVWRVAAALVALVALSVAGRWWMLRVPSPYVVASNVQVTNMPGLELDAAISPDGKLVAYAGGPSGHTRVVVRQISGGTARLLTASAPEPQRTPRWSPDMQQITFLVGQKLFTAPAFGGAARELIDAAGYEFACPALSPDGTTIAFARFDGIYVRSLDGGNPRKVASARWPSYLVWSPDGGRLAYVSDNPWFVYSGAMLGNIANSSVWTVRIKTGETTRVSAATRLNASPVWAPGGRAMLYVSSLGGGRDIYQQALSRAGDPVGKPVRLTTGANAHTISLSADGSRLGYTVLTTRSNPWWAPISPGGVTPFAAARALSDENQTVEGVAVSPDGKWLAFDSNRGGHQQIFKLPIAGGEPVQLTRDSADAFDPMWSPDGRMITFHSWKTGNRDVDVMTADGDDIRDVTGYSGHEMGPAWSPDGNQIIFIGDRTGRWEMHVVGRAPDGRWSDARQVTKDFGSGGRFSPDGRTILYLSLTDTTLHAVDADGSHARLLLDGHALGLRPQNIAFSREPGVVYFLALERDGRHAFYSFPLHGGLPRLLFRFDDPARQPRRPEFDTDGKHLFFTLASVESDVWVMELARK
jgi:eukaryotic-like serine/threonine-protein kinase